MAEESLRLDQALTALGYFASREQARRSLLAGEVEINNSRTVKPGLSVLVKYRGEGGEAYLFAKGKELKVNLREKMPYVSRGGYKLAAGLDMSGISPEGMDCLDVGASTGGFTDVLLQRGAKHVFALDCGYGQLHDKIRHDERVTVMEKFNARFLKPEDLGTRVDLAVADVSFISLKLVAPPMKGCLKPGGLMVVLVKPQFEVGPEKLSKGGVVRDEADRLEALRDIRSFLEGKGFDILGECESPIVGPAGNHEFLLAAKLREA